MCYNNAPARQLIARDFDLGVSTLYLSYREYMYSLHMYLFLSFLLQFLDEYSKSEAAKRNRLIQMMHNNNNSNNNKNSNSNNRAW